MARKRIHISFHSNYDSARTAMTKLQWVQKPEQEYQVRRKAKSFEVVERVQDDSPKAKVNDSGQRNSVPDTLQYTRRARRRRKHSQDA